MKRLIPAFLTSAILFAAPSTPAEQAQLLNKEGLHCSMFGQFACATSSYSKEADLWRSLGSAYRRHLAITLTNLAEAQMNSGELAASLVTHQQAVALTGQAFGPRDLHSAEAMTRYAGALICVDSYDQASKLLTEAASIEDATASTGPEAAATLQNQTLLAIRLGRTENAEQLLEALNRIAGNAENAAGSLEAAVVSSNLAQLYMSQGRYDRAQPLLRKATAAFERQLSPSDPRQLALVAQQGMLYLGEKKLTLAEDYLTRALSGLRSSRGENSMEVATVENSLALVYVEAGKAPEADRLLNHALGIQRAAATRNRHLAATLLNLGLSKARQREYGQALEKLKESVEIFRSTVGEKHPETAKALTTYAEVLKANGGSKQLVRMARDQAKAAFSLR